MALKFNINMKAMPLAAKVVITFLPAIVISVLVIILLILPRHKEIQRLNEEITKQENDIAKDQVKAAKLSTLKTENEKLQRRLDELKLQLPEEREVSGLLKQVSDLGIKSGLKIISWKPEQKKDHPSGTIYEIPVAVELSGSYHNLGIFFSRLTKLNRIVNISDIRMGSPQPQRDEAVARISFKATTFSAVPEQERGAKAAGARTKKQ
ncbi:MAG TPA: type 4a pilus biogenesis protein PilO [Thermodesulfovibrionales bacterium]|nr:type 4a pilus biogenesis protein PilO [Thermodesulfovibrionales bacterium]